MIAIVKTGGKQYKVAEGTKIKVEKLDLEVGKDLKLDTLFTGDDQGVVIGAPLLKTQITATVVRHGFHKKVTGIKFKAKKRELTRFGHRQPFTELEIKKIA